MVFFSLYLSNLSKRLGGSEDSAETAAALSAGRPDCPRLATINGRRIGRVAPAGHLPASHRRSTLRLIAVNGARLA